MRRIAPILGLLTLLASMLYVGSFHVLVASGMGSTTHVITGPPSRLVLITVRKAIGTDDLFHWWQVLLRDAYAPLTRLEAAVSARTLATSDPLTVMIDEVMTVDAHVASFPHDRNPPIRPQIPLSTIHALSPMPGSAMPDHVSATKEGTDTWWSVQLYWTNRREFYMHDGSVVIIPGWG